MNILANPVSSLGVKALHGIPDSESAGMLDPLMDPLSPRSSLGGARGNQSSWPGALGPEYAIHSVFF